MFAWTQSSEEQQVDRRNRLLLDTGSSKGGWPGLQSQASVVADTLLSFGVHWRADNVGQQFSQLLGTGGGSGRCGWPALHSQASGAVEQRVGTTVRSGCGSPRGWAAVHEHPATLAQLPSGACCMSTDLPAVMHAACQLTRLQC